MECQAGDKTAETARWGLTRSAQHSQAGLPPSSAGDFSGLGGPDPRLSLGCWACSPGFPPVASGFILWATSWGSHAYSDQYSLHSAFPWLLYSAGAIILTQMRNSSHKFMVTIIRHFSVSSWQDLVIDFILLLGYKGRVGQGTCDRPEIYKLCLGMLVILQLWSLSPAIKNEWQHVIPNKKNNLQKYRRRTTKKVLYLCRT